jgi:tellurite resistance protein
MAKHHDGLIYTMVLVSAADRDMTDAELLTIGEMVRDLPVFGDYDGEDLTSAAEECAELLAQEDGLDRIMAFIKGSLPERLRETAYAVACDIAAADSEATQEELQILEILRHRLEVDRLAAAAIERGARARHMTV